MAEREWKECDLCAKEVFTKKDADGFISICPECREDDKKELAEKERCIKELVAIINENLPGMALANITTSAAKIVDSVIEEERTNCPGCAEQDKQFQMYLNRIREDWISVISGLKEEWIGRCAVWKHKHDILKSRLKSARGYFDLEAEETYPEAFDILYPLNTKRPNSILK